MPTVLTQPLPALNFARNPIIASFTNNTTAPSARTESVSVEIQVWVEPIYNSGTFVLQSEFSNPYNIASGQASFNISRAILPTFNNLVPNATNENFYTISGIVKRFKLRARDVVGGIPEGSFTETAIFHAIHAGTSKEEGEKDLSDLAYVFLATRKTNKRIHLDEKIHIEFLPLVSGNASINVNFTTFNSSDTFTMGTTAVTAFVPQGINVPLPNRSAIKTFSVEIIGLAGSRDIMEFEQVTYPVFKFRQLFYRNSMGGFETLGLIGLNEFQSTTKSDIFETEESVNPSVSFGNSIAFNQRTTETFILRSGFLSPEDIKKCIDLPLRNEAFLFEDNLMKKLFIQPGTFKTFKDRENLFSLDFQARLAYSNHSI